VFIVGMEEGLLPHIRSMDNPAEMEEERRLCYVGITRAQERLYLLRAFRRGFQGGYEPRDPSRFLADIPRDMIVSPRRGSGRVSRNADWSPQPAVKAAKETDGTRPPKVGEKVRHAIFGDGIVISTKPSGEDFEVTVAFTDGRGVKRLLLSFAPLETVS
jgi:DNA helicase-2/ATP-dependent DNA helicase PcrA